MENEEIQYDEIGYIARQIDTKLTTFERMKINKSSYRKIIGALGIYTITMLTFIFIL